MSGKLLLAVVATAGVAVVSYYNSLDGDLLFDDMPAIVNNKDVQGKRPLKAMLNHDFWGLPMTHPGSMKSYRPVTTLSFRMSYAMHGKDPFGYHVVNVALHALVSVLVMLLGMELLDGDVLASTASGVLFAAHPVHVDAVASSVSRAEVLCGVFYLFALFAFIKCSKAGISPLLTTVLTAFLASLSMLCKEPGITVLGVCAAYDIIYTQNVDLSQLRRLLTQSKKLFQALYTTIFLAISAFIILFARLSLGDGRPVFTKVDNPAAFIENTAGRWLTFSYYHFTHAWMMLNPLAKRCCDWAGLSIPVFASFTKSLTDPRLAMVVYFYVALGVMVAALFMPAIELRTRCAPPVSGF